MMHRDQTHIKRNCFSIGIISSKLHSGCYTLHAKTDYGCNWTNTINALDQVHKSPTGTDGSARAHSLIIQIIVTYMQRGHHALHWFNLRDDTHLPVVKQHYPQLLTLKKIL
jgi:hypothetical protein